MTSHLRLLDLALSYAIDNPAIHQNDAENIEALYKMRDDVFAAIINGVPLQLDADPLHVVVPDSRCTRPPTGWVCTRYVDHDGPCAAVACIA